MASWITTPRRAPTWIVPDGVLESLTTCGPLTAETSSSAQNTSLSSARPGASADGDDLVGEVPGRDLHNDAVALLASEERATDRRFVGDLAIPRIGLGRSHDGELLASVIRLDRHVGADGHVVGGVLLL